MSIQSSINQGILATAALVSQNPEFQENKKEAAYEKKLNGTLKHLMKTGKERMAEIDNATDEAIQSGDEQLLYDQLERFKQEPKITNDYFKLKKYQVSEAQKHYMEKGDLENYSKYTEELKDIPRQKQTHEQAYEVDYSRLKNAYSAAQYRNEYLGYLETKKELDKAEQIQSNTNNYHKMLKNKSKVDVVGERNGK